jgi:hypothetical protein
VSVSTWCVMHVANAAGRLEAFEQELQRRRLMKEHRAAVALRLRRAFMAVAGNSPYRSSEVH